MFQLLLADLFAKNNDFLNAAYLYNKIIIENPFPDYAINSKLKLNLLSSGTDSLKKFLDGKPGSSDRNSFIKFLAGPDRLLWFYQIINMEKIEKADLQKLFKKMGKFEIKNDIELYVLSKISQFYKDQGCLTEAKELAVISVNYKAGNKGMEPLLKENLKKLNYLIIFGNDIKKKFIIN